MCPRVRAGPSTPMQRQRWVSVASVPRREPVARGLAVRGLPPGSAAREATASFANGARSRGDPSALDDPSNTWDARWMASSGQSLHDGLALAVGGPAKTGVVVVDDRLQVIGFLKALEGCLARELVHSHVLELVLAQDFLVAPCTDGTIELQHLRRVLLVVPFVELGLLVFGDGGTHDEDGHRHWHVSRPKGPLWPCTSGGLPPRLQWSQPLPLCPSTVGRYKDALKPQFPGPQFPGPQFPGPQFPGPQSPGPQFPGPQFPGLSRGRA